MISIHWIAAWLMLEEEDDDGLPVDKTIVNGNDFVPDKATAF